MPSDDNMPPLPPTVSLPAMTERAILEDLSRGFREMRNEMSTMRADIGLIANDHGLLKKRVSMIDELVTEESLRVAKHSGGVRQLSESDAGQNMQIASLATQLESHGKKVDALAKTTVSKDEVTALLGTQTAAILARFDVLAKSPLVKMIVTFVVTALGTWLASKGIKVG